MSDWKTITLLARRSLIVLGSALALALTLYGGSRYFRDSMRAELAQVQQVDSASQASLTEKLADLPRIQAEFGHFGLLRRQGMVGVADREGWVEQFVASHQRSGLPGPLTYTLQVARPLALQAVSDAAVPVAAETGTGVTTDPVFHDLDFDLKNIQEEELLTLLGDYQAQVKGRFRVNACKLSARTETGLSARCTLRFFTLPEAAPNPVVQ